MLCTLSCSYLCFPPGYFVNFNMMPPTPCRVSGNDKGGLAKGWQVVVMKVSSDVLQKLDTPNRIDCLFGPPGTSRKIVFYYLCSLHRMNVLRNGIVTSFHTLCVHSMGMKPGRRNALATPDIENRLDSKVFQHALPQGGRYSFHIQVHKAS